MHAREIGRERSKVLPSKGLRKIYGRREWIRIFCGMGIGRDRKH